MMEEVPEQRNARQYSVPAQLPLARGHLLLVGSAGPSITLLPTWVTMIRDLYHCDVRVCLTYSASRLVSPEALAAASGQRVWGPDWPTSDGLVAHVHLAEWADAVIVAPATAAFVGAFAQGIPESLALCTVLSTEAPVVVAPSLAAGATKRLSVRRNLALLDEEPGVTVLRTSTGRALATGEHTPGAMAGLSRILMTLGRVLHGEDVVDD